MMSRTSSAPSSLESEENLPEVKLLGKSDIFTNRELITQLNSMLPSPLQLSNWKMLYSVSQHGANFGTFYSRVQFDSSTLMILENSDGAIFGAFTSSKWRPCSGEYYGTGESFVFALKAHGEEEDPTELLSRYFGGNDNLPVVTSLNPTETINSTKRIRTPRSRDCLYVENDQGDILSEGGIYAKALQTEDDISSPRNANILGYQSLRGVIVDVVACDPQALVSRPQVVKYAWTGANSYFMMASENSIALGGGGDFALYLDDHFARGATGRSDTYGNKPLCQRHHFDIVNLEVWGFTQASSLQSLAKDDAYKMRRPRPVLASAASR